MKIVKVRTELPHEPMKSIGFVPTMGAFHEGHLDLMRAARAANDVVVVSLFVNPTQFGPNEDLAKYPRDLARDASMAESVGVDYLFAPDVSEIYPQKLVTTVHVSDLTHRWEGEIRPHHFEGVSTVVTKLFNIVRPTVAYFGQKDLQQCAVIQRMVADLNMPIHVEIIPTTREVDGLAMSSRNIYLCESDRKVAVSLFRELSRCADLFRLDLDKTYSSDAVLSESRLELKKLGFDVNYFQWIDLETLEPINVCSRRSAIIAAAKLGNTRLIDNVLV